MMNIDTPEITPQVLHIGDLLKKVRRGEIRIPNFQRAFVWDRPRMRELFDSVRRQYPIGTLLFWNPPAKSSHIRTTMGPLTLPPWTGNHLLVLDGQQRLTTLAGVLLLAEQEEAPGDHAIGTETNVDREDPGRWRMYFDASKEDGGAFIHLSDSPTVETPTLAQIPVASLLDSLKLFDAVSKIMTEAQQANSAVRREDAILWVQTLQAAAGALSSYRLPVIEFVTDQVKLAVDSFARLNRQGRSMGPDEMFSALTYQLSDSGDETFHLSRKIDGIVRDVERLGFGRVDRVIVLRSILAAAEMDPYRTDWDRLGKDKQLASRATLPKAVEEARRGLRAAVDFLIDEGIYNLRMLPYSMQLVAISACLGRCATPTVQQRATLAKMLWVTSFTAWFGRGNPSRVRKLIEECRDRIATQPDITALEQIDLTAAASPFPQRYDMRSARVRASLCATLRDGAARPRGSDLDAEQVAAQVLQRGPEALSTICASVNDRALRVSPANRIIDVEPRMRGQAKNWLLYFKEYPDAERIKALKQHHIDEEAWTLLTTNDHDGFVARRLSALIADERAFLLKRGVTQPVDEQMGSMELDVEDEVGLQEDLF